MRNGQPIVPNGEEGAKQASQNQAPNHHRDGDRGPKSHLPGHRGLLFRPAQAYPVSNEASQDAKKAVQPGRKVVASLQSGKITDDLCMHPAFVLDLRDGAAGTAGEVYVSPHIVTNKVLFCELRNFQSRVRIADAMPVKILHATASDTQEVGKEVLS